MSVSIKKVEKEYYTTLKEEFKDFFNFYSSKLDKVP